MSKKEPAWKIAAREAERELEQQITGDDKQPQTSSGEVAPSDSVENTEQAAPVQAEAKPIARGLSGSTSVPTFSGPSKDRLAVVIDIRKLGTKQQIRDRYNKNPEALSPESIARLADLIESESPERKRIRQSIEIIKGENGEPDWINEGHRRVLACTLLAERNNDPEWYEQPATYGDPAKSELDRLWSQLTINNSKESVDIQTTIQLLAELKDQGVSQDDLAKRSGYSKATVSKMLKVMTYDPHVQELIFSGELPYTGTRLDKYLKELKKAPSQPEPKTQGGKGTDDQESSDSVSSSSSEPSSAEPGQKKDLKPGLDKLGEETTRKKPKVPSTRVAPYSIDADDARLLARLVFLVECLDSEDPFHASDAASTKAAELDRKGIQAALKDTDHAYELITDLLRKMALDAGVAKLIAAKDGDQ